tara:strand:+ start:2043 stop:2195 length:153 start_codon:yes stop_codon:yes gene_type:complete
MRSSHPLTNDDCTALRRISVTAILSGLAILILLMVHQLTEIEAAIAASNV